MGRHQHDETRVPVWRRFVGRDGIYRASREFRENWGTKWDKITTKIQPKATKYIIIFFEKETENEYK